MLAKYCSCWSFPVQHFLMLPWNRPWRRNKMIILLCQRKVFGSGAGQGQVKVAAGELASSCHVPGWVGWSMPVKLTLVLGVGVKEIVPAEHGALVLFAPLLTPVLSASGQAWHGISMACLACWRLFPCADEAVKIGKIPQGASCCQENSLHWGDLSKLSGRQALPMQAAAGAATCRAGGRESCSEGTVLCVLLGGHAKRRSKEIHVKPFTDYGPVASSLICWNWVSLI